MSFLVLINRGPVDDRVETILESFAIETPGFADWIDYPQECIPKSILKEAADELSNNIISLLTLSIDAMNVLLRNINNWYHSFIDVAKYIQTQLHRIGVNPAMVTYVDIQPHAIQITLES